MGTIILLENELSFRLSIQEFDNELQNYTDISVIEEISRDRDSRIEDSLISSFCVMAIQIGLVELFKSWGINPAAVAGHSVGEFVAAYTAGVLNLKDVLKIRWRHHVLMEKIAGKGKMVHISLPLEELNDILSLYKDRIFVSAIK